MTDSFRGHFYVPRKADVVVTLFLHAAIQILHCVRDKLILSEAGKIQQYSQRPQWRQRTSAVFMLVRSTHLATH